jgi:hypothetical protein
MRAFFVLLTIGGQSATTGRGFDLAEARRRGNSLGLGSIDERARLLGGSVHVETHPGRGTRVQVQIPQVREQTDYAALCTASPDCESISGRLRRPRYWLLFHWLIASGAPLSSRVVSVSTLAVTSQ